MAETKMQLDDWLDDLCVRFIINLPREELESVERICFQVEEAQWFYEDFIRPLDSSLPSMNLRQFCLLIFQHCPLLAEFSEYHHSTAFEEFLAYKTRVPVRGAIMLNDAMDEVVLVKGWKKSASWSFPRGKINKGEKDLDCAVREVYEETGYDLAAAGLVPDNSKMKFIEVTMREQHMKLYVFRGVPQDTIFHPRTRKEISDIQWYQLASLPGYRKSKGPQKQAVPDDTTNPTDTVSASKLYMVAPFLVPLKKWIGQRQRERAASMGIRSTSTPVGQKSVIGEKLTADDAAFQQPQENDFAMQRTREAAQLAAADAATRLKYILSVGTTAPNVPTHAVGASTQSKPGDLLAMLQHGARLSNVPPTQTANPPQTPLDQIDFQSPEPRSPRHHHPPPPLFSTMPPPPAFPYTPSHVHAQDRRSSSQFLPRMGEHHSAKHNGHLLSNPGMDLRSPMRIAPGSDTPVHLPTAAEPFSQQVPRPYQRTGDPQFARSPQFPDHHVPGIPPASNLPPPKLNSHALNLLNAFRGTDSHSLTKIGDLHGPSMAPQSALQRGQGQSPFLLQIDHTLPGTSIATKLTNNSKSHQPANDAIPTGSMAVPAAVGKFGPPVTAAKSIRPSSAHQDALLKLFRSPSAAEEFTGKFQIPLASLAPEPIELSAMPSPGLTTYNKQFPQLEASTQNEQDVVPIRKSLELPSDKMISLIAAAAPTSATVTGPQDIPDFGSVRRRPRNTKHGHKEAEQLDQRRPTPIQILKRPAEAAKQVTPTRMVPKPREVSPAQPEPKAVAVELKGTLSKPFQPQILRRPQQASDLGSEQNSPEQAAKAAWQSLPGQLARDDAEDAERAHKEYQARLAAAHEEYRPNYKETFRRTAPGDGLGHRQVVSVTKLNHSHSSTRLPPLAASLPSASHTSPATAAPYSQPFDRRISTADNHKQTLLSLFNKAKIDTAQSAKPSLIVSPLNVKSAEFVDLTTTNGQPVRSRINSVAGGDGKSPTVELSRSRINSIASAPRDSGKGRGASGSQPPISPLDRGFLINYLEGVIKSVGS